MWCRIAHPRAKLTQIPSVSNYNFISGGHEPLSDYTCNVADQVGDRVAAWLDWTYWTVLDIGQSQLQDNSRGQASGPGPDSQQRATGPQED